MSTEKYTTEQFREETGLAAARIVQRMKSGETIDGKEIHTEKVNGERVWWLGDDEEEDESARLEDADDIHGRTINGLAEHGIETADDLRELTEDLNRDDAIKELAGLDGVGKKGAQQAIVWLRGVKQEDPPEEEYAYPGWVYEQEPADIAPAKRAVEAARTDGETPRMDDLSASAKADLKAWLRERNGDLEPTTVGCPSCDEVQHEAPITQDDVGHYECDDCGTPYRLDVDGFGYHTTEGHEIRCPHCGGIFDVAPVGAYESDYASCSSACAPGVPFEYGDCGERFYLEAGSEGYETFEEGPEGAEAQESEECSEPEDRPEGDQSTESEVVWPDEELQPARMPEGERPHPLLTGCRSIGQYESGSEEWHEVRSKGIGSSDVGAILGLSDHADAQEIWAEKVESEEVHDKPWLEGYAAFGTWFEHYIRQYCEAERGERIIHGEALGTLQSCEWGRARANLDGLNVDSVRIEEIKTTSEEWTSVPGDYHAQVQHQMMVTGLDTANIRQFVCPIKRDLIPSLLEEFRGVCMVDTEADRTLADWLLDQGEIHTWVVERDEDFIERMLERERQFWSFVEDEIPPPEADPEGTVDLTDDPELYADFCKYSRLERQVSQALTAERNGETVDLEDLKDETKKSVRRRIEEQVALEDGQPKRVRVGEHKATLVERESYSYWNLYTGEGDDVPL